MTPVLSGNDDCTATGPFPNKICRRDQFPQLTAGPGGQDLFLTVYNADDEDAVGAMITCTLMLDLVCGVAYPLTGIKPDEIIQFEFPMEAGVSV